MSDIVERLAEFNQADIVDRLKQLADIEYVGSEYLAAAAEIERLRAHIAEIEKWKDEGERIIGPEAEWGSGRTSTIVRPSVLFKLGAWWERRPWKARC